MAVVFLSPRPCEMVQFMVSRLVTSPSFFPFGQRGFRRSLRLCQMAALALTDRYSVPGGDGTIPALGLGTSHNGGRNVGAAVEEAARAGVRLFDTAQHYGTEETLGEALRKSGIPRKDLFISTKVWPAKYDMVEESIRESMARLQVDYIDLVLLHWPGCEGGESGRMKAWRQLEAAYRAGLVRAIGVSNFLPHHLEPLYEEAKVKPAINQCEFNPMQQNMEVVSCCKKLGVVFQGYCPLAKGRALENETVCRIAAAHKKTAAQVLIRWSLEKGAVTIPKSTRPERVRENCNVYDFHLTAKETADLDALHCNLRVTWDPTGVE